MNHVYGGTILLTHSSHHLPSGGRYVRVHVDRNEMRPLKDELRLRQRRRQRRLHQAAGGDAGGVEYAGESPPSSQAGRQEQQKRQKRQERHRRHRRQLFDNLQPSDLNTDGIDPSGRDVWIHHCHVQNDDDSIAVKPCNAECKMANCSQDMVRCFDEKYQRWYCDDLYHGSLFDRDV